MKKIILFLLTVSMLFSQISVLAEEAESNMTDSVEASDVSASENGDEKPVVGEGKAIFVDVKAKNGGDGSFENPFNDIQSAKTAAASSSKNEKVTVYIREGEYELTKGLEFSNRDSGTKENPVTFCAYNGENVVISGAKTIKKSMAKLLGDETVRSKVPKASQGAIWEIDLSKTGVKEFGKLPGSEVFSALGTTYAESNYSEFIYDDAVMNMARYPNADYLTVSSVLSDEGSGLEQVKLLQLSEDAVDVKRWEGLSDVPVAVQDSSWGYRYTFTKMFGIDAVKNAISVKGNLSPFNAESRFFVYNLPQELDAPCEYYFDRENSKIYFYSPDKNLSKSMKITVLSDSFLKFNSAENITFKGIKFENGRGDGASISNSKNIVIDDCVFTNIGGMGITCYNGYDCQVSSCEISNIGYVGVLFYTDGPKYADIKNMVRSNHIIKDNDIYNCGRIKAATCEAIRLNHVIGVSVLNNRIHNVPHSGILGYAVDSLVAYNEVYDTNRECFDAGAIYFGGTYTHNRGLVIEKNYVHDNHRDSRLSGGAVVGIYLDDKTSGVTVNQNVVQKNFLAMLIGGGNDHIITDNLNVDNNANITYDNRGMNWSKSGTANQMAAELNYIGWPNSLWEKKFPTLVKLDEMSSAGDDAAGIPYDATITGNMIVGSGSAGITTPVIENAKAYEEHIKISEDMFDFVDKDNYDLRYTENSKIYTENNSDFPVIDFENIGLSQKRELGVPEIMSPVDKAENIEGNAAVFRWKLADGADRYRVQIGFDENFYAKVYDEVVVGNVLELKNLKYDRTYYWRVQAVKSSFSEEGDGEFSPVYSFKTAKSEMLNKTELSKALDAIGTSYLKVSEGTTPGTYKKGAIEEFDKVVKEATDVLNNSYVKQSKVKAMISELEEAKKEFNSKQNILITNVDDFIDDEEKWTGPITINNGEVYLDGSLQKGNYAIYSGRKINQYEIVRIRTNTDLTNYQAWGMNTDSTANELWEASGYVIVGKRNVFEIQRYSRNENGQVTGGIIGTVANEESIMTSGKWYDVEIGCVKTPFGTRVIMNIDGKNIVDFLDSSEMALTPEGYFAFYEGSGEYNTISKVK